MNLKPKAIQLKALKGQTVTYTMTKQAKGFTHESTRAQTVEWYTPKYLFEKLNTTFDLDPCSPGKTIVPWIPTKRHFTKKDGGLNKPWKGRVWLNPPYGRETPRWLKRLVEHGNGIALLFARPDTQWFHQYATQASLICFPEGRIRFIASDGQVSGTPGCGSMLLAYGPRCAEILRKSRLGVCLNIVPCVQTSS